MPTPTKPVAVLIAEGKSHRTKAELAARAAAEASFITGKPMRARSAVKNDPVAYKEFKRLCALYETIGKNDALIEGVINRYCMLLSEEETMKKDLARFQKSLDQLNDAYEKDVNAHPDGNDRDISDRDYFKIKTDMENSVQTLQRQIQGRRKMMLEIEKENIMTIVSQLRAIPKKAEDDEADDSMAKLFEASGP